jgi:hypothetical protein
MGSPNSKMALKFPRLAATIMGGKKKEGGGSNSAQSPVSSGSVPQGFGLGDNQQQDAQSPRSRGRKSLLGGVGRGKTLLGE